jgi:hypothetical protein
MQACAKGQGCYLFARPAALAQLPDVIRAAVRFTRRTERESWQTVGFWLCLFQRKGIT